MDTFETDLEENGAKCEKVLRRTRKLFFFTLFGFGMLSMLRRETECSWKIERARERLCGVSTWKWNNVLSLPEGDRDILSSLVMIQNLKKKKD